MRGCATRYRAAESGRRCAKHAPAKVLGDAGEAVLRLLELLEELVVLVGALLLLLHVLLHAAALRRADDARVLVVGEARLVEGVHAEEVDRGQLERVVADGALGELEDLGLQ